MLALFFLLALSAAQYTDRQLQEHLSRTGHLTGPVDGIWGRGSHAAFHAWASAKYGSAYTTKLGEYRARGRELDIRRDPMFHGGFDLTPSAPAVLGGAAPARPAAPVAPVNDDAIPASGSWSRGSRAAPEIAITFDDGPHRERTPRLLDILKKHGVVATFYVQGQYVKRFPEIIRRMVAEGHEVGHHSYDHPQLSRLTEDALNYQIDTTINEIVKASRKAPTSIRPPYGATNPVLNRKFINKWGMKPVLWDVDPEDWKPQRRSSEIVTSWTRDAKNGSILLAHDIHEVTIQAMDEAVAGLKARGFTFRTASDLIARN